MPKKMGKSKGKKKALPPMERGMERPMARGMPGPARPSPRETRAKSVEDRYGNLPIR